jgi:glycerol-3-phosphate dehydrogenase
VSAVATPPFDRRSSAARLASENFDVLVVGGGVTGCGVAVDAAARGLSVALVEGRDFASGTSSKSSKMVHGGLRYLQQHDFLLVYEALHERQRLLHNAPHLVHPLPFVIPLFGRDGVLSEGLAKAYSVALWLYDLTGGVRIGRRHRRISSEEALAHFPVLRTDRLVAAFVYWDAQADDARLTLTLARTAARYGAAVANYCPVESLLEENGRVSGARLDNGMVVRARVVVNASGVWSEQVARMAGDGSQIPVSIRPAKGIHITVPSERLPCDRAAVLTVPGDRRSIFVVPWAADEAAGPCGPSRYTYLGTTDTDYNGPLDDPRCSADDVEYVLRSVNAWTTVHLSPRDVTGAWAGLRPLISEAHSARTADLSRRHRVMVGANGLVTVTGGKLTTYRKMAADTVDIACGLLARRDGAPAAREGGPRTQRKLGPVLGAGHRRGRGGDDSGPGVPTGLPPAALRRSPTRKLVLLGGDQGGRPGHGAASRAQQVGISAADFAHLAGRHGSETDQVLELCEGDRSLAATLVPGLPYLRAEAVYAARHEMAYTLADVLARRTRALILNRDAAVAAAGEVAALLGAELGWDHDEQARQVDTLRAEADIERRALSEPVTR